jgi:putative acyl-CoA dehydrogenase
MTFAAFPALSSSPSCSEWLPKLTSTVYDPHDVPISEKEGVILGMSMTESQGGSDVRANTTRAVPLTRSTADGSGWALRGAKWFTSAPNSDAFLTLAKTGDGGDSVSCFLVPRWLPDGTRNKGFRVVRLKDKLGDKSNASSEVEYDNAWGQLIGKEGRGIATIMEMVVHTRLDCAIGSAAIMRQALRMAVTHCRQRSAFGTDLIRAPLMRAVLADVAIESEASILLSMQLAHWFGVGRSADGDGSRSKADMNGLRRLATAVAKYLICKRAPGVVAETLECMGGNGFDVRWDMERLYRQAPLNSLWEGSGNVQALDVLRTMQREPKALAVLLDELRKSSEACGEGYASLLRETEAFAASNTDPAALQANARLLTETLGTLLQAHVLAQKGDTLLLQAFVDTRLARGGRANALGSMAANSSYGCRTRITSACVDHVLDRQIHDH